MDGNGGGSGAANFAIGGGLGLLIGIGLIWSGYADRGNALLPASALVLAASAGVSAFGPRPAGGGAWAVAAGLLLSDFLKILVDTHRDPTSHNLWPIELVVWAVVGGASAGVGALVGWAIRHARGGA